MNPHIPSSPEPTERPGLSYKFQRLREKLRNAITSGELTGKLPGERALARRFHVNAKTLSKALTDLAAEGLLDRSIGRGTYVKGHSPLTLATKRWLLVCNADQVGSEVIQLLRTAHPELDVVTDTSSLRPSFLNQFSAVIDLAVNTPESFLRDLVVRNIPVVVVGKESRTYSTHAVLFDLPLAVSQLARDLVLAGHHRIAAIELRQSKSVSDTLRLTVPRYAPQAQVETCTPSETMTMIENGITAFVCQSLELALNAKQHLESKGIPVPDRATILAVDCTSSDPAISGYYLPRIEKANPIVRLLSDPAGTRPTTLWLAGQRTNGCTFAPLPGVASDSPIHYNRATA